MRKVHCVVCIAYLILFYVGIVCTSISNILYANGLSSLFEFCTKYCQIVSLLSLVPVEFIVCLFSVFLNRSKGVFVDLSLLTLYGVSWLLYIVITISMTGF